MDNKSSYIIEWLAISLMIVMVGTAIVYAIQTPAEQQDMGLMAMMMVGAVLGIVFSKTAALERQLKQMKTLA